MHANKPGSGLRRTSTLLLLVVLPDSSKCTVSGQQEDKKLKI